MNRELLENVRVGWVKGDQLLEIIVLLLVVKALKSMKNLSNDDARDEREVLQNSK